MTGQWQIDAAIDPDNRVMIVTDLKLKSSDLPNNILMGESFDFNASLTEHNKVIVRTDFLDFVDARLSEETEVADPIDSDLNKTREKGVYRTHVGDNFKPGRNDVVISFNSPTFERERRQSINVIDMPFTIDVEQLTDAATRTHRLTLIPDLDFIKDDPLSITALLTGEDGSEWSYEIIKNVENKWQITLADLMPKERYTLAFQIRGETVKGRSLFLQPDPIVIEDENAETLSDKIEEEIKPTESDMVTDEAGEDLIESEPEIERVEDEFEGDEMSDEFDELLPEDEMTLDDELDSLADETESLDSPDESAMSPAIKLAVGNSIILILALAGIFLWRRKKAATKNPGEQL